MRHAALGGLLVYPDRYPDGVIESSHRIHLVGHATRRAVTACDASNFPSGGMASVKAAIAPTRSAPR
jgi:hypothetical protein